MSETPHSTASPPPANEPPRRNFLVEAAAVISGGIVALAPLVSGALFFLDPLKWGWDRSRNRKRGGENSGASGFIKVGRLDAVPVDGAPVKFTVIADRFDAWNTFLKQPIGAVYVRRDGKGGVAAFSVICPHLGCSVDYEAGPKRFHCPCHDSNFTLEGTRQNQTPPRDLDSLEVDPERLKQGEVWVKYQNFRTGETHKVVKS